jgi:lysyl-tRNA synthetase class 2
MKHSWEPSASLDTLRARAELLTAIRAFFSARGVMEVDTPALSRAATVDRHIESFATLPPAKLFLHTSPEFAMKRLLAAGSGPIYQLSHVFRAEEAGRHHNPEFMLLEWYRPGWDHRQLMGEVQELVRSLVPGLPEFERRTYAEVFLAGTGLDPHRATLAELKQSAKGFGLAAPTDQSEDRDFWLNLWMGLAIGPTLGKTAPLFVDEFPASQAALARIRPGQPPKTPDVAERFELFWQGRELANGFHELLDAAEQQQRFEVDRAWRNAHKRPAPPYDRHLIAALQAGLPDCAGVALGVDRLLMLKLGLDNIAQAMPFDSARA